MSNDATYIFAIETTVRELDARLVLAALHARKGRRILVVGGQSGQRVVRELPGAVFLGKAIIHPTSANPTAYFEAKKNGLVAVHLAEEGAIFQGTEPDWRWDLDDQLHPTLLNPEDFVCTWGDFQRDHYVDKGAPNPTNIRTTGHPRFDIYKASLRRLYEDEAASLKARYGDFVILCSNFPFANDAEGPWNTFSAPFGYVPSNEEGLRRFLGRWVHMWKTFPEFIELFHKLAMKRRDVNFIVRPHPSDNVEFFRYAFAGVPNIIVSSEGTVVPWLMAARAMVHAGCTTAVEAHMLGCPIVNFRPLAGESYDYFLPNVFGSQCKTQEESIDAIQAILEQPASARSSKSNEDIPERAHQIFANFKKDAMGLVLGVLGEAEQVARGRSSGTHAARLKLGEARFIAVEESKHLVRRAFFRTRYLTAQHNRQRFGGFDRAAVEKKLAKLRDITGNSLELQVHSRNIIELSSTRAGD